MSKIDAAVYEMMAESLERIQGAIQKVYQEAEKDSPEDVILGVFDDAFTEEIDALRNLADEKANDPFNED